MKILIVNSYYYLRGGDCQQAFSLAKLFQDAGLEVYNFSMQSEHNLACRDENYFVSEIDFRKALTKQNPLTIIKVLSRSIYSTEARRKISMLLDDIQPDIAHLHSIRHHLTKSILPELEKRKIPIVWTLHDYKELCPNTTFYDGKKICEACKGGKYLNVVKKRCKKGSLPASVVTYLEAKVNDMLRLEKHINLFISPSNFLRDKFLEYGFDPDKIVAIPNFIELDTISPQYTFGNYLLYLGRLEKEKGLVTLVKAFRKAKKTMSTLRLKIAGTGCLEEELRLLAEKESNSIDFLGYLSGNELKKVTREAKAIIIPSEWYENYPFSCLEAMAYGKPVIASRIGGLPEMVEDGVTGFLFTAFDKDALAERLLQLTALSDSELELMGKKARRKVEESNSPEVYLNKIQKIYSTLINH